MNLKGFIFVLVALLFGTGFGYFLGQLVTLQEWRQTTAIERAFQDRLEAFEAECAHLSTVGVHGPIRVGGDYIFVNVEEDYFHIIGFNAEPGHPIVTGWWGAGRQELIRQVCSQAKK